MRDYNSLYRIVRPSDGEVRWISVKSVIERDENGKAMRLVGAHNRCHRPGDAQKALRESERNFRTLANAVRNTSGRRARTHLNWFNPRVYEKTGAAVASSTATSGAKWSIPRMRPAPSPHGRGRSRPARPTRSSSGCAAPTAAYRWFLGRAVPARDDRGRIIRWIGTNTDVHDQKTIAPSLRR